MEEVDGIILDSLRNLNCDMDEEIQSLKDFNAETVVSAVSACLEAICPDTMFPNKLPASMSMRLKLATQLADHIKQLGYRSDMGYQTILYCNEVEVRRVLMFLVERLPREPSKTTIAEELGYVPRLVKEIEERIKLGLSKPWVPSTLLKRGVRICEAGCLKQSCGDCYPLQTAQIQSPQTQNCFSEDLKYYYVHHLPDVTRQCSQKQLIPSLLFKDTEFPHSTEFVKRLLEQGNGSVTHIEAIAEDIPGVRLIPTASMLEEKPEVNESLENKIQELVEEITVSKQRYKGLHSEYKNLEAKFAETKESKVIRENALKDTQAKVKTRSKTLAVLSKEENLQKLRNLVENANGRMTELTNQWKQVQTPLLEEYQSLHAKESKMQDEKQKLDNVREKNRKLIAELKDKEKLEAQLLQELEKLNTNTNRDMYTKRIYEIIGNIKKQNEEIDKILNDTTCVQKDINNLNGQVDRSFTLSDELIFRDAKKDEMARRAYKLLVTLHTECGDVVQAVADLGLVERECRNFQDQVDAELAREVSLKLEKVNADIFEIKRETVMLMKRNSQLHQQV